MDCYNKTWFREDYNETRRKLMGYFISDQNSGFYQSEAFYKSVTICTNAFCYL